MNVHSDKKRKPRYWVSEGEKILFESDDGTEAVQWAINHTSDVKIRVK